MNIYYLNNNLITKVFLTMAQNNTVKNITIFNSAKTINKIQSNHINSLEQNSMNTNEEYLFNTYRHWVPFYVPMQNVIKDGNSTDDKGDPEMQAVSALGTKSLFNQYNAVFVDDQFRADANMPLLDNPETRKRQRKNNACTIKDLVDASAAGLMGRQVYNYSDFAYCKYLGQIPNNYLITLRRFGAPCGDRIDKRNYSRISKLDDQIQQHMPDIGRLVTWIGTPGNEMSNILKYTYSMGWEDKEAKIDEVNTNGDKAGPLAGIFNMANSNYRKNVQRGLVGNNFTGKEYLINMVGGNASFEPPYNIGDWQKHYYSTKVYGPVDVIDKTKKRKRGLEFEQKFTLTFDYELRSYYGVNGKAAMADLLGNILATTYTHGHFWGGERRWIGAAQDNIFANLPIFKLADSGGLNNPAAVMDAYIQSIHQGAAAFTSGVKGETTMDKIKNLAKDVGGMLLGGILNKLGRPEKYALSSLVSGAPVGPWHLTIGNPKSPILEVGNLICTGCEIEHYGPLGLDDFPTGLRVKVNLEHGKPRDIMGIEQMYGRGDTRIYSPLGSKVLDMYNNSTSITPSKNSSTQNSKENSKSEMQQNTQPIDSMDSQVVSEDANTISNTKSSSSEDLTSLMRYFGTTQQGLIKAAGGESLYGSGKHKNDHAKK